MTAYVEVFHFSDGDFYRLPKELEWKKIDCSLSELKNKLIKDRREKVYEIYHHKIVNGKLPKLFEDFCWDDIIFYNEGFYSPIII